MRVCDENVKRMCHYKVNDKTNEVTWEKNTTLIIGGRMLYGVEENKLKRNTKSRMFRGSTIEDMYHYMFRGSTIEDMYHYMFRGSTIEDMYHYMFRGSTIEDMYHYMFRGSTIEDMYHYMFRGSTIEDMYHYMFRGSTIEDMYHYMFRGSTIEDMYHYMFRGSTIEDMYHYMFRGSTIEDMYHYMFRGSTIEDMYHYYITPLLQKRPENIIVHVGTNNCVKYNFDQVVEKLIKLKDYINSTVPMSNVIFSTLITRMDDAKAMLTVLMVNKKNV